MDAVLGPRTVKVQEVIADGPTRAVAVMTISGNDADGHPWTMPALELTDFADGKITKIELFIDTARLHENAH